MLQDMTHQALTCLRAPAADPDEWDEQTMLNLAAPMRLTRHLVPTMARSWALVQHSRSNLE
jgi:NAD(P)-dependent dehydrogenase (short-subunit alcohol dehydrogenase family)